MPLTNRVTPLGDVIADPARGLVYGNRGCLHDEHGRIRRHHNGRRWIACRLQFRGWHRTPLMAPGRYTELFFLDEATALAAGHRPCALCRREDYSRLTDIWRQVHPGQTGADAIDAQLHLERWDPATGTRITRPVADPHDLPDGSFVFAAGRPRLVVKGRLLAWTPAGYTDSTALDDHADAELITPPSLVALLRAGWDPLVPLLHPSANHAHEADRGGGHGPSGHPISH